MEEQIIDAIKKHKLTYIKIYDNESMVRIHSLWCNNNPVDVYETIEYFYYGRYYKAIKKDYDKMKEHYQMAIDNGDSNAMNNLACYYSEIEKDYDRMKEYYLMAIDKDNLIAMSNLGCHYQYVEKDYDKMKEYYLMAIDKGDSDAMYNLGTYYKSITYAMNNLGIYYKNIEKDYDKMKEYFLMAIDNGHSGAMTNLVDYYTTKNDDYTFLELYKHANNELYNLINDRMVLNVTLPKGLCQSFCEWILPDDKVKEMVINKQHIFKTTRIFPSNYSDVNMVPFMEVVSISRRIDCPLPSEIMMMIAGYLFV